MAQIPSPVIVRSDRRTASLYVLPNATVLVKAPLKMSDTTIQAFVKEHSDWIEKRLAVLNQGPIAPVRDYKEGEQFFYLGKIYSLTIGNYGAISAKDDKLQFPSVLSFRIKKELDSWYIARAKKIITELAQKYAMDMQVTYQSISFSDTKSRWGACTHDNHLQFNWRLVMAPMLVIIYVVTHELSHIDEKNHSADFWRRVRRYNPSYVQSRKWLKTHGNLLFL